MAFADGNWRDNPKYQERMNYYAPKVNQAVQQYGLEPQAADLIQGILGVESRWGLAKNLDKPGAAGELGIAQLTPGYRQQYGVKNPLDEQEAINAIAAYVSSARKRGAEWDQIPVGYNAGDGRLRQMLRGAKTLEQMPQITQDYVARIREFMGTPANGPSGIGNYSPAVTKTLAKYGLPTTKPVQPPADISFGAPDIPGVGALLGSAPVQLDMPRNVGLFQEMPQSVPVQQQLPRDNNLVGMGRNPAPFAGLFGAGNISPEQINQLLQGVA